VQEVAQILGIARASAFRAIDAGEIPSIRDGRRILIPTAALRTMLQLAS
jgi:excisionase family DNA binding protein